VKITKVLGTDELHTYIDKYHIRLDVQFDKILGRWAQPIRSNKFSDVKVHQISQKNLDTVRHIGEPAIHIERSHWLLGQPPALWSPRAPDSAWSPGTCILRLDICTHTIILVLILTSWQNQYELLLPLPIAWVKTLEHHRRDFYGVPCSFIVLAMSDFLVLLISVDI
jgi:hypothetical protein